jgi:hypothetical protein
MALLPSQHDLVTEAKVVRSLVSISRARICASALHCSSSAVSLL